MVEDEVRPLLAARGLGRVLDGLMALAEPTVRVYIESVDEGTLRPGASKLGGLPDLPPGVPWPSWHEPMAFIAQFNLAEVAPHDREGALPDRGLLSFFYETDGEPLYSAGWGLPPDTPPEAYPAIDERRGWRVLYFPDDPATFVRQPLRPDLNEAARYLACAARFAAEISLPDPDAPAVEALGLTESERLALIDLDGEINGGIWEEGSHRLLGHPYSLASSTFVDCEIAERGLDFDTYHADPARWRALVRAAEARWRLLFQVTASGEALMSWGGNGVLHFCIERDALRARDFSRVWVNMQLL
jgi:uncharacterized protein YwqG